MVKLRQYYFLNTILIYIVFKFVDSKWLKNSKTTRRVFSLYSRYRVHLVVEYGWYFNECVKIEFD